jgi:hypothetical protein
MKFSNGWFQGFRRRNHISLRCRTKVAQHMPEEMRPKVVNFLRFNRRNMEAREDSDCGSVERSAEVEATRVGRFLLSHISNMDQSPMPFELSTIGCTYDRRGGKTVQLKGVGKGWDKRMCTLQLTIHADGLPHTKPLLLFGGKEGEGTRARKAEIKRYSPGVSVFWNKKA